MLDRLTIERMAAFAGERPILIALSGGGDSTALLHLLVAELGATRLRAAVVDHALREGSADDAGRARGFAEALGVQADILTLTWKERGNRAQQAAREARYRVLCEHARSLGLNTIATAHTADDQAETVLMRAASGSAWRGLAGIPPFAFAPLWPEGRGLALARPLLGIRRFMLRAALHERSARWVEDPANANPAYARVRARARLSDLERAGFDPTRLTRLAATLRQRVEALDRAANSLIDGAARFDGPRALISRAHWRGDTETRRRALSALIAAAAGAAREPAWPALAALEADMLEAAFNGATLGGAHIFRAGGDVVIERDRGAVAGRADGAAALVPMPLMPHVEAVWDGRLAVRTSAPSVVVTAVGAAPRFLIGDTDAEEDVVSCRWLLHDRAAHALGPLPA